MTRLVSHNATGPLAVHKDSAAGDHLYVCRCGLSASPLGLCDGSHKATRDEQAGRIYLYERRDGVLVRVATNPVLEQPIAVAPVVPASGGAA